MSDEIKKGPDDRGGDDRGGYNRGPRNKTFFRKKVCRFCTQKVMMDYKNPEVLRRFVTESGKILPTKNNRNMCKTPETAGNRN